MRVHDLLVLRALLLFGDLWLLVFGAGDEVEERGGLRVGLGLVAGPRGGVTWAWALGGFGLVVGEDVGGGNAV